MNACLICDDHVLLREALAGAVLQKWPNARIGQCGDFPSAWVEAENDYDICIADLVMPGADPRTGIEGLMRVAPGMRILVVTGFEDDALLLDLLAMGAAGFSPKTASSAVIEAALVLIGAGGRYLPPRIAELAASRVSARSASSARDPAALVRERLTERQLEVLRLVARGLTNKEIGLALDLAPSTVKTHIMHIQTCLGAANRTDASIKAQGLKLLDPPER